jgi:hypothetical protein
MADDSFLRKQAWDYFTVHASQRISIFNFYIVLSSLITTTYFASFKSDTNWQVVRACLGGLLCLFSFIFWKLDQRTKIFVKTAERALRQFENMEEKYPPSVKVFTQEEIETGSRSLKGWHRLLFWRIHLSYSDSFNSVFIIFFALGLLGLCLSPYLKSDARPRVPDRHPPNLVEVNRAVCETPFAGCDVVRTVILS